MTKRWSVRRVRKDGSFEFVNGTARNIHKWSQCKGRNCCMHNPSDHGMRSWPMLLRETGLVERICEHGVGHPDPDSAMYFNSVTSGGWEVHGCDGCCYDKEGS